MYAAIRKKLAIGCAGIALTVALLIIGDEILAGKVEDTNSSFLCRELYALGLARREGEATISVPVIL